jgi:hypothetical protein
MRRIALSLVVLGALAAPALADSYPVSGRFGESTNGQKGAIDCTGKRVIEFSGNQRRDSDGGVPAYRNRSVSPRGPSRWHVTDAFSNGQVSDGHTDYTLQQTDADRIELQPDQGGTIKLQRCK